MSTPSSSGNDFPNKTRVLKIDDLQKHIHGGHLARTGVSCGAIHRTVHEQKYEKVPRQCDKCPARCDDEFLYRITTKKHGYLVWDWRTRHYANAHPLDATLATMVADAWEETIGESTDLAATQATPTLYERVTKWMKVKRTSDSEFTLNDKPGFLVTEDITMHGIASSQPFLPFTSAFQFTTTSRPPVTVTCAELLSAINKFQSDRQNRITTYTLPLPTTCPLCGLFPIAYAQFRLDNTRQQQTTSHVWDTLLPHYIKQHHYRPSLAFARAVYAKASMSVVSDIVAAMRNLGSRKSEAKAESEPEPTDTAPPAEPEHPKGNEKGEPTATPANTPRRRSTRAVPKPVEAKTPEPDPEPTPEPTPEPEVAPAAVLGAPYKKKKTAKRMAMTRVRRGKRGQTKRHKKVATPPPSTAEASA